MRTFLGILCLASAGWGADASADSIRNAATKAVALIQSTQKAWYNKQSCSSCHQQYLPALAFRAAREHGIPVNEDLARANTVRSFASFANLDRAVQYTHVIDAALDDGNHLVAADAAGVRASVVTAVYARFIARRQMPDGRWFRSISARRNRTALSRRPPSACAPFSFTVMRAWPSKRKSASSARKRGLHRMHRKTRKTGHTSCLDYPGPAPNAPGSRNWLATSRQRKGPTAAGTRATACQATPTRQARRWWPCAMPAASRLPIEPGRAGFGSCYRPRPLMVPGMLVRACTRPRQ